MRKLYFGVLFVNLNYNINIGDVSIGLIPSFIGYALMVLGLREMAKESKLFRRPIFYAQVLMIYSFIAYILGLVGVPSRVWLIELLLGLISAVASLYMMYCIIRGIKDMEKRQYRNLNGSELYQRWRLYVLFTMATFVLGLIPVLDLAAMILAVLFQIWFLFCFYKTQKLYYEETI